MVDATKRPPRDFWQPPLLSINHMTPSTWGSNFFFSPIQHLQFSLQFLDSIQSALQNSKMKVITANFVTCAVKECKTSATSFPLHFHDAELELSEVDFQPEFIRNVLPRVDWEALKATSSEVHPPFPQAYLCGQILSEANVWRSSDSPPSPKPSPKAMPLTKQPLKIYTDSYWRRKLWRENWFVGIADISMLLRRGLLIFCCRVIWVSHYQHQTPSISL